MTCLNCGCEIGQQFTFQGVVICGDCYKMVSHFIQRAKSELNLLFLTYTDMLRVSLIRGQLRPPTLPQQGMSMPKSEFLKAFQQQIKEMGHENSAPEPADGDGTVQGVRGQEADTRCELHPRTDAQAVRGGRGLRVLPQVQEDWHPDDHRTATTGTDPTPDGMDQGPRR